MLDQDFIYTLLLTGKLALITTLVLILTGIPIAYWLNYSRFKLKFIAETLICMPMVLPPTVMGYYLLVAFSPENAFGNFLQEYFDVRLAFSFSGIVVASIIANLPAKDILVIDFDPDVIGRLRDEKIDHLFGDLTDPEIFERAHFETARLVISTSPNLDDNLFLLERMNSLSHRPKVVVRAETEHDVKALYAAGADYVLLPHMTAGQYLGKTIAVDPEMGILASLKKKDMEMVRNRKMLV